MDDETTPQKVGLYSSSEKRKYVVLGKGWSEPGEHTIAVEVRDVRNIASSDNRVDIDAFVAL